MNYWLIKSEPVKFTFDDLLRDKKTHWDGVRNYQARNNLKAMKKGDICLYYHSNEGKEIVGLAEVIKEAYPDHTADEDGWVMVDVKALKKLKNPVTLEMIKMTPALKTMALIKQSRLSVSPVTKAEFDVIQKMGS